MYTTLTRDDLSHCSSDRILYLRLLSAAVSVLSGDICFLRAEETQALI